MHDTHRLSIRVSGENGQGLTSMGELLARALKREGFYTYSYREYPSLIMGGWAFHQIDVSDHAINAASVGSDILVGLSRVTLHRYLRSLHPGGRIIHGIARMDWKAEDEQWMKDNNITEEFIDAQQISVEVYGSRIMANTVLIGMLWKTLGLSLDTVKKVLEQVFAEKPKVLEGNFTCLQRGFDHPFEHVQALQWPFGKTSGREDDAIITGNQLTILGAIAAGMRAYFSYPMTPASPLLSYVTEVANKKGILAKQLDDEITVAQTAIGAMFMGTRALIGTSGGGFDLMTESLSLSGMIESPFVAIIGQRPGPATGLPTWTAAGDLNLAVYAGHGEFPRAVLSMSDAESSYRLVQHAFNLAEKYQIPVLVLMEKNTGEALYQIEALPENLPIERGLVPDDQLDSLKKTDRFKFTDSGISPRWLPGQADATYDANSDEHTEDGSITEEAEASAAMYSKRLRKLETLKAELPEPRVYGPEIAEFSFVGWGSVKDAVLDAMHVLEKQGGPTINYLHYEYIFPVKTEAFQQFAPKAKRLILIENNGLGQLGGLLTQHTSIPFWEKFLKFNGRPFFVEDILDYVMKGAA